ncbi:MAG: hypothetical protein LBT20_02455 [Clostridiales bacterium]|jgi:hypothetical protein|nr:hypothetical protein [Clostridiales bacterium]
MFGFLFNNRCNCGESFNNGCGCYQGARECCPQPRVVGCEKKCKKFVEVKEYLTSWNEYKVITPESTRLVGEKRFDEDSLQYCGCGRKANCGCGNYGGGYGNYGYGNYGGGCGCGGYGNDNRSNKYECGNGGFRYDCGNC